MLVRYIDIDNDVVILADNTDAEICAEIQAVAADSGELDDDTAVDSSDVRQTLALSVSRMSSKVHAHSRTLLQPMVGVRMWGRRGRLP